MNWLPVNGGPLNGGSRLALVAAASAIACSSLVAAVAVRAQEALSPVYSGARITAAPTLQQAANAGVGGTSFLAARPKHTVAAGAKIDAAVDLRGFVFRGVEAKAKFVSGADFLAIPASVLGVAKANPCSATVEAVATKRQPGKSGVSPAGVSIVADSVAKRGAVATTAAGLGAFYAETAINGVGEAYGRVTPSAQVVATGLVTRPARAAVSAGADCQAVGAHVVHGRASVASGGYDVFAAPHVIARGSSGMAGSAELVAVPKRELRPRAAAGGTAGLVASTKTNHGSAAVAVQGAVAMTAKADRKTAAASNALASANLNPVALRTVKPAASASTLADFSAQALLTATYSRADDLYSTADFAAQPDVTVRMADVAVQATAAVGAAPYVTRYGDGVVPTSADLEAVGTRVVQPKAMVDTSASTVAGAIRVLLGGADVGFGVAIVTAQLDTTVRDAGAAVVAGANLAMVPEVTRPGHAICWADSSIEVKPTRLVYPESTANTEASVVVDATRAVAGESWALVPWCWFEVVPDVTVRQASSQMEVLHVLDAVGTVVKEASAHAVTLTDINPTAVRVLVPAASITTRADFEVHPRRTAKVAAATSCVAFFSAAADVTIREAGAVADSVGLVQAHPVVCHAGGATVVAEVSVAVNATRTALPQANGGGMAGADVQALRVLEAESWALVPWCWFEVVPDVTVREGEAVADGRSFVSAVGTTVKVAGTQATTSSDFKTEAVRVLVPMAEFKPAAHASAVSLRMACAAAHTNSTSRFQAAPDVTVRQATASSSSGVVATAKATVKHSAKVQSVSTATVVAAPVVKKLAQSALGAGAVFSGRAVRSVWAIAEQDTGRAFFAVAPDVTVRKGVAVASTSANLFVSALVDRHTMVALATTAGVRANPAVYRAGNADIYCEVYLRVAPIANLFSFDPANRTFYRQATTTNFVRNAPITEFRRPA